MVNFRFHLVSLTAVFLALAIGIGIGATVVDQGQVDVIKDQLDSVRRRTDETNAENERLRAAVEEAGRFEEEAADQLVAGRLDGVPVLLVGVQGIDRGPVDALRLSMVAAGATYQGAIWFTTKLALDSPEDVDGLGALLELESRRADVVRRALINRLATSLTTAEPSPLLVALRDRGYVEFEPAAPTGPGLDAIPAAGTRIVLASDRDADVDNALWAAPLAIQLSSEANAVVVAVEAGRHDDDAAADDAAPFVSVVRTDEEHRPLLSTVDNIGGWRGRMAVVLAIDALVEGRTGHFGQAPDADGLIPEPPGP